MRALLSLITLLAGLLPCAVRAAPPTPLEYGVAVEAGNAWAVKQWLDEGLPPDFRADRIGSGLMIAAWTGNLELMQLFLERGADIHLVNPFDEQALQLAAWRGHLDAVRLLLERGAAVNREGKRWGALHYAVFAGHGEIARLLIEKGADVNARTPNDSTALMLAAREGQADLARALLDAGADARPVNEWGDSALAFAMRHRHYGIAKMVAGAEGQAQAAGKPTDGLRRALAAALALHRYDSEVQTLKTRKGKGGKPEVLVITAKRNEAGRERAELLYEAVKAGAAVTTPAEAAARADAHSEISAILERLQQEKGRKGRQRSAEELRRQLHEAVARFRQEAQAVPVKPAE